MDDISTRLGRIEGKLDDFCERHNHAVFGNGKAGLVVRMDRLERSQAQTAKSRKAVWSAVVSIVGAAISSAFGFLGPK